MRTKIVRNIFISVGVLFAAGRLLTAGSPQSTIITFDAPGAGTGGPFQGTLVAGINPAGVIAGGFLDANEVEHTYLHFPDGTITTFNAPGAGTGTFQGSFVFSEAINNAGAIAGAYFDSSNVLHGFLRTK